MVKQRPREKGRRRIGKIFEWEWFDVVAEAFLHIFRLLFRGIRSLFD